MAKHECLSTCDRPSCPACDVLEAQAAAGRELAEAIMSAKYKGQFPNCCPWHEKKWKEFVGLAKKVRGKRSRGNEI